MIGSDEETLVEALKRGDRQAMQAAYSQHAGYLLAVCSRYIANPEEAKDTLQEAFVKIFLNIKNFHIRDYGTLRSWMAKIVVNESLKALQRSKRLAFIETVEALPDTIDEMEVEEIPYSALHEMICVLPDGCRTVLNLYVFERMNHKEIAALLGIKEDSSACQYHRAKKLLAEMIKQYRTSQYGR